MLTVEKIGGTSMTSFGDVLNNIIKKNNGDGLYNRIFVVSAYGGVTNWLLEHKKTGEPGVYEEFLYGRDYRGKLDSVLARLKDINKTFADIGLNVEEADRFITKRIQDAKFYLNSMEEVIASGYVDKKNMLLAAREILASIGESHSAYNSVNILNNNQINATLIDLSGFNDSKSLTIDQRIHHAFSNIDLSQTVVIATGYTKGTEGIMRAFDRGYSEVTFSKIAVEVKADEAVIHKEFHLSSADPGIVGVENAIPVGNTNFIVADQLADVGMEAIHPKASKPLELAGINIRIKNTFDPDHTGTLISRSYIGKESKVEIVTGSHKVVAIEIYDPWMVGEVGFDLSIMQLFQKHKVSYITKSTNANCITMVIWEKAVTEAFMGELQEKYEEITRKDVALICVIGTNIAKPGILYQATKALADNQINVICVSQSMMQVNMQFVIEREQFSDAVRVLNKALCLES